MIFHYILKNKYGKTLLHLIKRRPLGVFWDAKSIFLFKKLKYCSLKKEIWKAGGFLFWKIKIVKHYYIQLQNCSWEFLGTLNRYFYLGNGKYGKNRCLFLLKLLFFPGTAFWFKIINIYDFYFLELKNMYFRNFPVRKTFFEFSKNKFIFSNNKNPRY